jgi:hypothetical protein
MRVIGAMLDEISKEKQKNMSVFFKSLRIMMLFVLLVVLAGQIFVLTTNANLLFVPNNVSS